MGDGLPGPSSSGARGENAPWIEKYRPSKLDEVAAHTEIIATIKRFMNEDRLPHLLFYGPPGTGKTSTILALAREMYGSRVGNMVLELNASDDRGIGVVRQEIQDFASTMLMFAGKALKLVILDECDAMTKDAQFALRRVIEKYSRNTRFCLICNYASKIIPALQSRCTRFRFAPLPETFVRNRVEHVCQVEGVKIDGPGLDAVVRLGAGDMRRTLNILQSTAMAENDAGGAITERAVYSNTDNPLPADIKAVARSLLNDTFTGCMEAVQKLQIDKGVALVDVVRELLPHVTSISMPPSAKADLVEHMAEIEYRLAFGTNDGIQLGALVGAFVEARQAVVASV